MAGGGRVATYGQIAGLIGRDRNARLVGKVLSMAEYYGNYPCHRVVNHAGRLAPNFYEQEYRLREEGVQFLPNGYVDLKRFQWMIGKLNPPEQKINPLPESRHD